MAQSPLPLVTRGIPNTRESLPCVGLGTWQVFNVAGDDAELAQARETLRVFTSLGGRVIDSSPMYGSSEDVVGSLADELNVQSQLFVATKVWTSGGEAGKRQMRESLAKLKRERIELMQVHNLLDVDTHWPTLKAWQSEKRFRYVGLTHYHAGAHAELERAMRKFKPDFVQFNYSLAERDAEKRLFAAARELGCAVLVNRPFAEGALFSRARGKPMPEWAKEIGATSWAQVFLKFILAEPAVTCVIPGTRNPKHVEDNLRAATGTLPDAALRARIADTFATL